jgi:hypothetical protein
MASKRQKVREHADLTRYRETEFVSKNKKLQALFDELVNADVELNEEIYEALTSNNYRWFDDFVRANPGVDNFYVILQQLFLIKYFLPDRPPLTRKQMQNALGIQQVRWSTDSENRRTYPAEPLTMHYYQDFATDAFNDKLFGNALLRIGWGDNKMYPEFAAKPDAQRRLEITAALQDTIWYSFSEGDYLRMYETQDIFWIKADGDGNDPARDQLRSEPTDRLQFNYFPLPEMMWNLGDMFCFHTPELIFGVLMSQTLSKFIVRNGTRPYHMHLAGERDGLNLNAADGVGVMIEMFWTHDMQHERLGSCDPKHMLDIINRAIHMFCRSKNIEDCTILTTDNVQAEFENPRSVLNQFIDSHRDAEGRRTSINAFLLANDEPTPWRRDGRAPRVGGRKTEKKSKRTKKCLFTSRAPRWKRSTPLSQKPKS